MVYGFLFLRERNLLFLVSYLSWEVENPIYQEMSVHFVFTYMEIVWHQTTKKEPQEKSNSFFSHMDPSHYTNAPLINKAHLSWIGQW